MGVDIRFKYVRVLNACWGFGKEKKHVGDGRGGERVGIDDKSVHPGWYNIYHPRQIHFSIAFELCVLVKSRGGGVSLNSTNLIEYIVQLPSL